MQRDSRFIKRLGMVLFVSGLLLAVIMAFVFFWPDMEASLFDASTTASANESLRGLRCPHVITADETSPIQAVFTNPEEREISFIVRSRISQGFVTLMRQDSEVVHIAPGERLEMAWPVSVEDAAYGRVIMARVLATRSAAAAAQQSSCGILVVNVRGVTGQQLVILGLAASLLALGAGSGLWWAQERPLLGRSRSVAQGFGMLALVVLGSLVSGFSGRWFLSLLLLIVVILLAGALMERFSRH